VCACRFFAIILFHLPPYPPPSLPPSSLPYLITHQLPKALQSALRVLLQNLLKDSLVRLLVPRLVPRNFTADQTKVTITGIVREASNVLVGDFGGALLEGSVDEALVGVLLDLGVKPAGDLFLGGGEGGREGGREGWRDGWCWMCRRSPWRGLSGSWG